MTRDKPPLIIVQDQTKDGSEVSLSSFSLTMKQEVDHINTSECRIFRPRHYKELEIYAERLNIHCSS